MVYDALEMDYRKITVRKDPNCAVCGEHPTVTELIDYEEFCGVVSEEAQQAAIGSTITASELKDLIDADKPIFLVDVREPAEWEIVRIPGATLIPKDEILRGDALAMLPQDKQIVMYCKTRRALGRDVGSGEGGRLPRCGARAGRRHRLGESDRSQPALVLIGATAVALRRV